MTRESATRRDAEHFRGCLLGGAVGDALGAPVEFLSLAAIRSHYGRDGIGDFDQAYGGIGRITDDTQMTLFTAEGLLCDRVARHSSGRSDLPRSVHQSYLRWLSTQRGSARLRRDTSTTNATGWLAELPELHDQRAPGTTCLSALESGGCGTIDSPINDSKGCGGIMRAAPAGLAGGHAFQIGRETAAITHGHPTGQLTAGALASIISSIIGGRSLDDSLDRAHELVAECDGAAETLDAMDAARSLSQTAPDSPDALERLGKGFVAEEALAIAVYSALSAQNDFERGVRLAVNHGGDSDSTGAITGNILGALLGVSAIPERWLAPLELRSEIAQVADDLLAGYRDDENWQRRYALG